MHRGFDEFELDEYGGEPEEEEEQPTGPGWDLSDEMLLRLHQVSMSNRQGLADRGFPKLHRMMEAKGLLAKRGEGWVVTTEGQQIIKAQRERLRRI